MSISLEDAGFTPTRRTGAIMIHPSLVHRGKDTKEKYLLARFQYFSNNKAAINEVK